MVFNKKISFGIAKILQIRVMTKLLSHFLQKKGVVVFGGRSEVLPRWRTQAASGKKKFIILLGKSDFCIIFACLFKKHQSLNTIIYV